MCNTEATGLITIFAPKRINCELPLRDSAGISPDFAEYYTSRLLPRRLRPYHNSLINAFPKRRKNLAVDETGEAVYAFAQVVVAECK